MKVVRDKIASQNGLCIFAGDLNVNPGTQTMRLFDGLLEDLTGTHKIKTTLSEFGKVPDVSPDHILVGTGIRVKQFRVLDTTVSDHKALALEFEITSV